LLNLLFEKIRFNRPYLGKAMFGGYEPNMLWMEEADSQNIPDLVRLSREFIAEQFQGGGFESGYSIEIDFERVGKGPMRDVTPELKDNEYRCAQCKLVFEKGWSEEEAHAEAEKNFGAWSPSMAVVCDDCYNKMMGKEG
jgi:hypothetical protein